VHCWSTPATACKDGVITSLRGHSNAEVFTGRGRRRASHQLLLFGRARDNDDRAHAAVPCFRRSARCSRAIANSAGRKMVTQALIWSGVSSSGWPFFAAHSRLMASSGGPGGQYCLCQRLEARRVAVRKGLLIARLAEVNDHCSHERFVGILGRNEQKSVCVRSELAASADSRLSRMAPLINSIALSGPNAVSSTLRAATPALVAITASINIHPTVRTSRGRVHVALEKYDGIAFRGEHQSPSWRTTP